MPGVRPGAIKTDQETLYLKLDVVVELLSLVIGEGTSDDENFSVLIELVLPR